MRLSILLLLSLMPLTAQYTARRVLADGVEVIPWRMRPIALLYRLPRQSETSPLN
jgi:hypothetical protein